MKTLSEVCNLAGLKVAELYLGGDVVLSPNETAGFALKDSSVALKLEPYADYLKPEQAQKVRTYAELHRKAEKAKKEREKAQIEAQKQAEADRQKREDELRQKQEADLRATIKMANPGISDSEIDSILPEMRREQLKQKTKTALIQRQRGKL